MSVRIVVLHGPNLNLLGTREPNLYGDMTLDELNRRLVKHAQAAGVVLEVFQSNSEGALIDRLHQAREEGVTFVIINPAGLTHTSVSLRDAVAAVDIPFVEVHLSNIYRREAFRRRSFFSDLAQGVICGLGWQGYLYALDFALNMRVPDGSA
jgi:3-dehydroquinate dehydratase-2